jgi:hypothetical protein
MLDIKLIRENPDLVKGDLIKRGEIEKLKWIDEILELDRKWRENLKRINALRKERNQLAVQIGKRKRAGEPVDDLLARSNEIVKQIEELEREVEELRKRIDYYLWRLPNITHESVPVGESDEDNVPIRFWGKARVWEGFLESFKEQSLGKMDYEVLDWRPRLHVDLLELLRGADLERAAKVSGSRFYYLMNELVILDLALIRFALDRLIEKGFVPVIPPYMVRRFVEEGATTFEDFEDVIYKVEGEDLAPLLAPDLLVEPGAGLAAESTVGDEFLDHFGRHEPFAPRIVGAALGDRVEHVRHRVEADDVGRAEDGRLGPPHGGSEQGVGFGDADAVLTHPVEHGGHAERADPVGDEVGGVLAVDDALAEDVLTEIGHRSEHLGVGVVDRYDFEESHVAHGVEEVRDHEVAAEVVAAALRHRFGRQTGGVGRDDASRLAVLVDHGEHVLLDVEAFNHHFDYPVTLFYLNKIVVEVTGGNVLGKTLSVNGRRFRFQCRFQ